MGAVERIPDREYTSAAIIPAQKAGLSTTPILLKSMNPLLQLVEQTFANGWRTGKHPDQPDLERGRRHHTTTDDREHRRL